eukprot:g866.t1
MAAEVFCRDMSFSYPAPRRLAEIVKLPLLRSEPAERVQEIWTEHHASLENSIADVWSTEEYDAFKKVAQEQPMFVLPVRRDDGYFVQLVQAQFPVVLMTWVEEYKLKPEAAPPYVTLNVFGDLIDEKGIALVRGDITNQQIKRDDAENLTRLFKEFYTNRADRVVSFNEGTLDFESFLRECDEILAAE